MLVMLLGGVSRLAFAQLQVLPEASPPCVFGGGEQSMVVRWRNASGQPIAAQLHWRLSQTSSATVAPLMEQPWKQLEMLRGQTILDNVSVHLPAVKAKTKFLIQWLADSNRVLGKSEVLVYPTNLLGELKLVLAADDLGVLDPARLLQPSLRDVGVVFLDLNEKPLEDFSGKLAVVCPFPSRGQMPAGLAQSIQALARKGAGVIWIQPPPGPADEITPSFYLVPEGKGVVLVVDPELVANFSDNPRSQLNFVYYCKLALKPTPPPLPNFSRLP
jgi:hypothetical protein